MVWAAIHFVGAEDAAGTTSRSRGRSRLSGFCLPDLGLSLRWNWWCCCALLRIDARSWLNRFRLGIGGGTDISSLVHGGAPGVFRRGRLPDDLLGNSGSQSRAMLLTAIIRKPTRWRWVRRTQLVWPAEKILLKADLDLRELEAVPSFLLKAKDTMDIARERVGTGALVL